MNDRIRGVFQLLDHVYIYREVGCKHEVARETYPPVAILARDPAELVRIIVGYVRHHIRSVYGRDLPVEEAFAMGAGVLRERFAKGSQTDGYLAAMVAATGRSTGNVPDVLNALAQGLEVRGIDDHVNAVFHQLVNPLSEPDRQELASELRQRYGEAFAQLRNGWEDSTYLASPSQLLGSVRSALALILARRIRFDDG